MTPPYSKAGTNFKPPIVTKKGIMKSLVPRRVGFKRESEVLFLQEKIGENDILAHKSLATPPKQS